MCGYKLMQNNAQKISNIFIKPIDKHERMCYNEDAKGKKNKNHNRSFRCNVNRGGNDMKMNIAKAFLKAVMEEYVPFVDKTRTMTGRVSENI